MAENKFTDKVKDTSKRAVTSFFDGADGSFFDIGKKIILFIKFTAQMIRDSVALRRADRDAKREEQELD